MSEKFDYSTISLLGFLLLPRERTLVAAGHVTSCDNELLIKSQLTFSFFAAVSHLGGPLRKQKFTLTGSKGHDVWSVIGGFRSLLWFLCFKVRCVAYYWRQRKTQLWRRLLNFRVRVFVKAQKCTLFVLLKQKLVLGANMSSCQTPGSKLYSGNWY